MLQVQWFAVVLLLALGSSCASKTGSQSPAKHYGLTGKVLSVNAKEQSASIDAAAIPGYMEAMTMTYPIKSKAEFDSLRAGEQITATVDAYESGDYDLSSVRELPASK